MPPAAWQCSSSGEQCQQTYKQHHAKQVRANKPTISKNCDGYTIANCSADAGSTAAA
jgi:hypothetical protein